MLCLVAAAVVGLGTLGIRAGFLADHGGLNAATATEQSPIYSVWKVMQGEDAYGWPQEAPFATSLYNGAFYYSYAGVLGLLGVEGPAMVAAGRNLTLLLTVLGLIVHGLGMCRAARVSPRSGTALGLWAMAAIVWLGTPTSSAFAVSFRPDMPALLFVVLALVQTWRALDSETASRWAVASLLFLVAWSLKQSVAFVFAGSCLYALVFRRRIPDLLALVVPFVAGVGLMLLLGGEAYRYNLLTLPTFTDTAPTAEFVEKLGQVAVEGALLWGGLIVAGVLALRARGAGVGTGAGAAAGTAAAAGAAAGADAGAGAGAGAAADSVAVGVTRVAPRLGHDPRLRTLLLCQFVPALLWGLIAMKRSGSSTNNILEGVLVGSVLWAMAYAAPRRTPLHVATAVLGLLACGISVAQMQSRETANWAMRIPLVNATEEQTVQREALAELIETLPKPLFTWDETFSLPWFSTDSEVPAYVIERVIYNTMLARGLLPERGIKALLRDGTIRSVVVPEQDAVRQMASRAGFRSMPLPAALRGARCLKTRGPQSRPFVVLVRD